MEKTIEAYRHITTTDEFKEKERLRSLARHNEAAALRYATEVEREKWQSVVADKDAALADKDAALADKDAALADKDAALADKDAALAGLRNTVADKDEIIAELRALLGKNKSIPESGKN